MLGALSGGVAGVSLSGVTDLALGDVDGLQVSGVFSLAEGDLDGVQLGVVDVVGGGMAGTQLGVLALVGGAASGLQGGVLTVSGGRLDGGQLGVVDVAGGGVSGAQLGVITVAGGPLEGLQAGVVNVVSARADGAQLGVVNVAGDVHGAQLGLVNVGGRVHGAQIGLINVAEEADAQIGLVGVQGSGWARLRVSGDSTGVLQAELVHGGAWTHMILTAGAAPFLQRPRASVGAGLGAHVTLVEDVELHVELLARVMLGDGVELRGPEMLVEPRVLVSGALVPAVRLYGGLGYQMHFTPDASSELRGPVGAHALGSFIDAWPALVAGLELF